VDFQGYDQPGARADWQEDLLEAGRITITPPAQGPNEPEVLNSLVTEREKRLSFDEIREHGRRLGGKIR